MAYAFASASSQYFSSTSSPMATAATITMSLWQNVTGSATGALASLQNSTGAHASGMYNLNNNSSRGYHANSTTNGQPVATGTLSANVWHHYCFKNSSATSRDMFRDGGNKGSNATNVTAPDTTRLIVGASWDSSNNIVSLLNGRIAELAIWNVALTDDEIASLAKGFRATRIRPQSLVYYAPLVRETIDERGAIALTATNGPTVYEHPRRVG